jgi:hypothetical protein
MTLARWTTGKTLSAASAILGAAGTILIFRGSFTYESPGGWMTPPLIGEMTQRNRRRQVLQRAGLTLLTLSFVLQGISLFFE